MKLHVTATRRLLVVVDGVVAAYVRMCAQGEEREEGEEVLLFTAPGRVVDEQVDGDVAQRCLDEHRHDSVAGREQWRRVGGVKG